MSECDHEALIMRRPWPTRGCFAMGNEILQREALIFSYVTGLLVLVCIGISVHRKKDLFLLDNTKDC